MTRYVMLAAAAFLALPSPLAAKEISLATMSEPGGIYEIGFCARPSPEGTYPGHAFVSFSHRPPSGERSFVSMGHTIAAGTSTSSALWSYFGSPVSGVVREEIYTSIKQKCLIARVNKVDFDAVSSIVRGRATPGIPAGAALFESYALGAQDCMTMMIDAADILRPRGLVVPARGPTELPMAYMSRFINAN